jgi:hypothetical protein
MPWFDAHSARVLTKESLQHAFAVLQKPLRRRLKHKLRTYAPLELHGDIEIVTMAGYVGIHTGRIKVSLPGLEGHTPMVLDTSSYLDRVEAHQKLLFSDAHHVVNTQTLYLFSAEEIAALCSDVAAKWCGEGERCQKFLGYCSFRGGPDCGEVKGQIRRSMLREGQIVRV